jgi:gliding motility-associated-like protein
VNSVGTISGVTINANGGNGGTQTVNNTTYTEAEGPGGGGGGGYIAISNGTPTRTATGGANGTTNSNSVNPQFPPNGATKGGAGNNSAAVTNFIINAPNVTICSGQSATLTATLTGTVPGGTTIIWYDQQVAGNNLGTGNTYTTTILPAGTYTYYVGTCPGTYHQPVIVTVTLNGIISAGPDVSICSSSSTTLNASGGTSYVWSPATGLSNPNISNPVATPVTTTTYICTATTSCGSAKDTVVVNIISSAVAGISGNTTICTGGTTTLTGSGGGNYSWSTGSTSSTITVAPTTNTTYSVFVGSGSCSDTASVTVVVSSGITASITGNTTICPGSPTTLTASGGSSYSWSTTATTAAIVVSPTANTTYTVTATSGSCSSTTSIALTVTNNLTATITGATTICSGGSAILNASGGNNYSWSTGPTTSSITVTPTTTTTYSVIASMGTCADTVAATVTVASGITATISGNPVVCGGSSTTLTASGGSSYSWSNGNTNAVITVSPTSAATYSVIVSSGSCADTVSVTVNVSAAMNSVMTTVPIQCGTTTGSASANITGGTPNYTYSWNPTGQTTSQATGLSAGGNYTLTVTDAAGCVLTGTVNVTVLNGPSATVTGNTLLCTGDQTTLTVSGGNTYSWSTGATTTSITLVPPSSSTFTVIAFVGNCSDTVTVTVNVLPPPVASITGNTSICAGSSLTLTASGGGNYSWSTGPTTSSITVSPTSTTAYTATVSIGSCTDTISATVNVVPVPSLTVTATNLTICGGDITTLSAGGGTTYVWSSGQSTSSISVAPASTTTYTVTSGNGVCNDTASVTVNVLPPPSAIINGNANICTGSAASLTAAGGTTYSWSSGETTAGINPSVPGTYSVIVTNGSCSDTAVASVTVSPPPNATALSNVIIIQGQSTNLTATGGVTYIWDNSMAGSSITVSPTVTTVYCVTATDNNGCTDTACVTVTVEKCTGTLYLPNAFSPNNDGDNDSLQVYYKVPQCIESLKLIIYNRWGEKVYETNDPAFRWDGIYNSGMLQNTFTGGHEVYAYYLDVKLVDGQAISQKGNISLLK